MSLKRLNVKKIKAYLFFRNPLPKISTLPFGQKGCAYYEWAQYVILPEKNLNPILEDEHG